MNRTPDLPGDGQAAWQALARDWLSALHEPAALVSTAGEIIAANRAFLGRTGCGPGAALAQWLTDEPDRARTYLRRAAASTEPLIGALHPIGGDKTPCRGSRLVLGGKTLVLLRLFDPGERFQQLTRTVRELNQLLRQREHEKAQLQEAIRDRDLLHRELQHRVKNNLQMLSGLLYAAKTEESNDAARAVLEDASRRFATVAAAHQSLYSLDNLDSVPAEPLISRIIEGAVRVSSRKIRVEREIADLPLLNDMATPLALVVNELLTNALKHARNDDEELTVRIAFAPANGGAELRVEDNGDGFRMPPREQRSSGLGLVRGLVRQLRGKLTIDTSRGTCFVVAFPLGRAADRR